MQLDDACRRTMGGKDKKGKMGIGGCLLLLSVWSWDRIPVGRPPSITYKEWGPGWDDPLTLPTWAYKYDVVSEMHNDNDTMYYRYIQELDLLNPDQVMLEIIALHYSVVLFLRKSEH